MDTHVELNSDSTLLSMPCLIGHELSSSVACSGLTGWRPVGEV